MIASLPSNHDGVPSALDLFRHKTRTNDEPRTLPESRVPSTRLQAEAVLLTSQKANGSKQNAVLILPLIH
jgi:hypothetical protein